MTGSRRTRGGLAATAAESALSAALARAVGSLARPGAAQAAGQPPATIPLRGGPDAGRPVCFPDPVPAGPGCFPRTAPDARGCFPRPAG